MSELAAAIGDMEAHIQVLWEYVADGYYDPRSIVGDNSLVLHEQMRDRIKEMFPRYETHVNLAGQLAFLTPSIWAIREIVERDLYDDEGRLCTWITEMERIFSEVKSRLTDEQLSLLERAEERIRERSRAKG